MTAWFGSQDGILSHFLAGPLDEFAAWVRLSNEEFPGELDADLPATLDDVIRHGKAALLATDTASAWRIDRLLDEYYGVFGEMKILEAADESMVSVRDFYEASTAIDATNAVQCARLIRLLLTGRPVLRDESALPYVSEDDVYRLSFWTHEECLRLAVDLPNLLPMMPPWGATDAMNVASGWVATALDRNVGLILTVA